MQFLKNPLYVYVLAFGTVILLYGLHWSGLYPTLSASTLLFFLFSFLAALFFGAIIDRYNPIIFFKVDKKDESFGRWVLFIYLLYVIEFIFNRGIPFFQVMNSDNYDYTLFGIPFFHPLILTFSSFYTVFLFHAFISNRSFKNFLFLVLLLFTSILIYNRAMLMINLTSCLFVFLSSVKKISRKAFIIISLSILSVLYLFGILGNYRQVGNSSSSYFLQITKASNQFRNSVIPDEYMWSYVYMTSPMANLQLNIDNNPGINTNFKSFFFIEILPDFVSKRFTKIVNTHPEPFDLIADFLNVGSVYVRAYNTLGWPGMILINIVLICGIFVYIVLLDRKNKYYITGIALACTFLVYNVFSNMISFSGLSFQLIYPLFFMFFRVPTFKFYKK